MKLSTRHETFSCDMSPELKMRKCTDWRTRSDDEWRCGCLLGSSLCSWSCNWLHSWLCSWLSLHLPPSLSCSSLLSFNLSKARAIFLLPFVKFSISHLMRSRMIFSFRFLFDKCCLMTITDLVRPSLEELSSDSPGIIASR